MKKVYIISFSPTGTSMMAAEQIAKAFEGERSVVDLCEERAEKVNIEHDSVCIFSMPCYGGRIPQTAVLRLSEIHGSKTPAIVCITFGNRAFEDALLELADSVEARGFRVIAGGALAAEHNIMHIYGQGRPDASDKEELRSFSADVVKKLESGNTDRPALPGNRPYKEWHGSKMPIWVNEERCTDCGLCTSNCPVNAISSNGRTVDEALCINCMRCIQLCPNQSRHLPEENVEAMIQRLGAACQERKANRFYL